MRRPQTSAVTRNSKMGDGRATLDLLRSVATKPWQVRNVASIQDRRAVLLYPSVLIETDVSTVRH